MAMSFNLVVAAIISCCSATLCIFMIVILYKTSKKLLFRDSLEIKHKRIFVETIQKNQKKKRIKQKSLTISFSRCIRFATLGSLFFYGIAHISALIDMFIICIYVKMPAYYLILFGISYYSWTIGRLLMTCVFICRLKSAFQDTKWKYSDRIFKIIYAILFFNAINLVINMISFIIHLNLCWNCEPSQRTQNAMVVTKLSHAINTLIDGGNAIGLTLLFHRRISQLIKSYYLSFANRLKYLEDSNTLNLLIKNETGTLQIDQTSLSLPTPDPENNQNIGNSKSSTSLSQSSAKINHFYDHIISDSLVCLEEKNDIELAKINIEKLSVNNKFKQVYNHTTTELINTIVQCTILVSISFITSMCVLAYFCFYVSTYYEHGCAHHLNVLFYTQFVLVIDSFINSLCLYLHFPFSLKLYQVMCYGKLCLHQKCLLCAGKCVGI
eukprot:482691_1